jgi:hypothetical protein
LFLFIFNVFSPLPFVFSLYFSILISFFSLFSPLFVPFLALFIIYYLLVFFSIFVFLCVCVCVCVCVFLIIKTLKYLFINACLYLWIRWKKPLENEFAINMIHLHSSHQQLYAYHHVIKIIKRAGYHQVHDIINEKDNDKKGIFYEKGITCHYFSFHMIMDSLICIFLDIIFMV